MQLGDRFAAVFSATPAAGSAGTDRNLDCAVRLLLSVVANSAHDVEEVDACRKDIPMKTDSFWGLIPKGVKVAAAIVFVCALIAGPFIGAWQGHVAGLESSARNPAGSLGLRDWIREWACWSAHWSPSGCYAWDMYMPMLVVAPCPRFSGFCSRSSFPTCWVSALLCVAPSAGIAVLKLREFDCRRTAILFVVRQPELCAAPYPSEFSLACFGSRALPPLFKRRYRRREARFRRWLRKVAEESKRRPRHGHVRRRSRCRYSLPL